MFWCCAGIQCKIIPQTSKTIVLVPQFSSHCNWNAEATHGMASPKQGIIAQACNYHKDAAIRGTATQKNLCKGYCHRHSSEEVEIQLPSAVWDLDCLGFVCCWGFFLFILKHISSESLSYSQKSTETSKRECRCRGRAPRFSQQRTNSSLPRS